MAIELQRLINTTFGNVALAVFQRNQDLLLTDFAFAAITQLFNVAMRFNFFLRFGSLA